MPLLKKIRVTSFSYSTIVSEVYLLVRSHLEFRVESWRNELCLSCADLCCNYFQLISFPLREPLKSVKKTRVLTLYHEFSAQNKSGINCAANTFQCMCFPFEVQRLFLDASLPFIIDVVQADK